MATQKTKKIPKRITAEYLHNSGLYYLQRYAASSEHFRQVMMRKIKKSCRHHTDQDEDNCINLLSPLIEKLQRCGLLNDDVYIRSQINSLRRKGSSRKAIIAKLRDKSVKPTITNQYLDLYDQEHDQTNTEIKAALILCRKKKMGCFAKPEHLDDENIYRKNLARLARAGFSYDIAKQSLDMSYSDVQDILVL